MDSEEKRGEERSLGSVRSVVPKSKAPPPVVVIADNTNSASYAKSSSSSSSAAAAAASNFNYGTRNLVGPGSQVLETSADSVVSSEHSVERSVEESGVVLEVSNSSQVYLEEDFEESEGNEKIEKWEDEEDYTNNDDNYDDDDDDDERQEDEEVVEREGTVEHSDESSYEESQKPKIASFSGKNLCSVAAKLISNSCIWIAARLLYA